MMTGKILNLLLQNFLKNQEEAQLVVKIVRAVMMNP